jgi:hypothetical protein
MRCTAWWWQEPKFKNIVRPVPKDSLIKTIQSYLKSD